MYHQVYYNSLLQYYNHKIYLNTEDKPEEYVPQTVPVYFDLSMQGFIFYSLWGRKELDMTEQLHFTSLLK